MLVLLMIPMTWGTHESRIAIEILPQMRGFALDASQPELSTCAHHILPSLSSKTLLN
jgi:hypothetical protein